AAREPGMARLVHHDDAEAAPPPAHPLPLGAPGQAAAAHLASGEAERPAVEAALRRQLVAPGGLPGRRPLRCDRRDRRGRGGRRGLAHDASLESTSVECVDRTPPFPDTSATSCRGTCRAPPSPRSWITASDTGVMPHM